MNSTSTIAFRCVLLFFLFNTSYHPSFSQEIKDSFNETNKNDTILIREQYRLNYDILLEENKYASGDKSTNKDYIKAIYSKIDSEYQKGNYLETIALAREYISIYPNKDTTLAFAYRRLGDSHVSFDDHDITLNSYFRALEIYEKSNCYNEISIINGNIGLLYYLAGDSTNALQYHLDAINILKQNGQPINAHNYVKIGNVYNKSKRFELAQDYFDSAYNIAKDQGDHRNKFYAIESIGRNYYLQDDLVNAEFYFNKALEGYYSYGNLDDILDCIRRLAYIKYYSKDYTGSLELARNTLETIYENKNIDELIQFSEIVYLNLFALKRYEEAAYAMKKHNDIQDSLKDIEVEQNKFRLQMQLEEEKRAYENKFLKEQQIANEETIQAQSKILMSTALGFLIVVIVALIIYRAYKINKRLSEKILQQSDKLKQLDEAKSRFFANISHDLRTPLTLMIGNMEQVLSSTDLLLTEKAEKQLKTGLLNGERIIHLTNEINELIKLEDGKLTIHRKYIDLDAMLKLAVKMFHSMAELKGIHLSYAKSIFDGKPYAFIDPIQFEKVLFNLITNALKHTKKNDSVTVALDKKNDKLTISVIDSGEGISEHTLPYLFDRYYQAPNSTFKTQEGFGIGLALVKEIITKHECSIEVKSKLGEGSEFIIKLDQENVSAEELTPLSSLDYSEQTRDLFKELDEPNIDESPVVNIDKHSSSNDTILIVEDHPEVRDHIKDIVATKYQVLTASNGQRALKILEKESIDLIITDLMMPWFDGFELLEKLRENDKLRRIPALVLSARTSEEDKNRVLNQGVNDFLNKPFKAEELLLRIENLLDHKKLWQTEDNGSFVIQNVQTLGDIEQALLKKVEKLIFNKIDDPNLSVGYLADEIAVSERKFYRMIKKLTGYTPFEFIKEVRMQYASRIIKEKDVQSASEIAKAIGMNNVSHFNTQFKKRFGKTPVDYK